MFAPIALAVRARRVLSPWWATVLIGGLAFAVRLASVLRSGGLNAVLGYDDGVYFGASLGLTRGALPYRDFVLVHPPGIEVLMAPIAFTAHLVGDAGAFGIARLAMMCLGAVNALLIFAIAKRLSLLAGLTAGLLYGAWYPLVWVERTTYLEAFICLALLISLFLLRNPYESRRRLLIAGAFMGLAVSVKLWAIVPFAVILIWLMLSRAWRSALAYIGACAAVTFVIMAPFFLAAPTAMFRMIITAQIERGAGPSAPGLRRLPVIFDVTHELNGGPLLVGAAILTGAVLITGIVVWKVPQARLWAALFAVQLAVVMYTPTFFSAYRSYSAIGFLLIAAAFIQLCWTGYCGAVRSRPAMTGRRAQAVLAAAGAAAVAVVAIVGSRPAGAPLPSAPVAAAVSGSTCVTGNFASALVLANAVTRNLSNGCRPVVFDYTGTRFEFPKKGPAWTDYTIAYLNSGDYVIVRDKVISKKAKASLANRPVVYRSKNGYTVYGPQPAS